MRQTFNLPDAGEGLTEAEILTWHVAVGDVVTVNQVIVEIETAKAAVELPSPYAGTVAELLVGPGDTVDVGAPIIVINSGGAGAADGDGAGPGGSSETGSAGGSGGSGGEGGGAKIGEVTTDGRIATLVGYVAAPGAATRRPRRSPTSLVAPSAPPSPAARGAAPSRPVAAPSNAHDRQDWRISSAERGRSSNHGDHDSETAPGFGEHPSERSAEQSRGPVPLAKPPVRKLAKELGVDLRELTGSGPHGDITRVDVQAWVRSQTGDGRPDVLTNGESSAYDSGLGSAAHTYPAGASGPGGVAATTGAAPTSTTPTGDPRTGDPRTGDPRTGDPTTGEARTGEARTGEARTGGAITGGVRRVPIRGLRRATAAAMVSSAFTAPHVTEFLTVDVTRMIELRDRLRARRDWVDVRLSPLTFAAKAVCLAARRTPEVNGHWDEEAQEIVFYERVQLGIAAATPRGLMVPKIRDADLLGLRELATALTELTEKARGGTTTPKELVGGTITITNVGVFGVDTGTPILNPGESAILALGAVKQAPWVVDGELAVRTVCHLALSFDHRVVDGEQGSRFLADVGALLSDPGLAMTF